VLQFLLGRQGHLRHQRPVVVVVQRCLLLHLWQVWMLWLMQLLWLIRLL
jgi:hypothetical protein